MGVPDTAVASMIAVAILSAIGALLYPLAAMVLLTVVRLSIYAAFEVRRWTFLLAYPATLLQVPLFAYGIVRRTFVWDGRRYRWRGKFDVRSSSSRPFTEPHVPSISYYGLTAGMGLSVL